MGAGASLTDILPPDSLNLDADNLYKNYFCHCCRSIFEIPITSIEDSTPRCSLCNGSFIEEISVRSVSSRGIHSSDIDLEQTRRLANAAFMLRIIENQIRDEIQLIQNTFNNFEENRNKKKLTDGDMNLLKNINIDVNKMCSQPSCPICSEDYSLGEELLELPCNHVFHRDCVIPWLEMKKTCPICRCKLDFTIPSIQDLENDSEESLIDQINQIKPELSINNKSKIELAKLLRNLLIEKSAESEEEEPPPFDNLINQISAPMNHITSLTSLLADSPPHVHTSSPLFNQYQHPLDRLTASLEYDHREEHQHQHQRQRQLQSTEDFFANSLYSMREISREDLIGHTSSSRNNNYLNTSPARFMIVSNNNTGSIPRSYSISNQNSRATLSDEMNSNTDI